ncbi:MAG: hypothetical protein HQ472_00500 [Ignavibacteria bacterium]|nr:hypothetical protein [Ignavibacteria bacterium]
MRRLPPAITKLFAILCCLFVVVGCNETPTDISKDIVPGTDSIYALSSASSQIMPKAETAYKPEPLVNNSFMLFGKTTDSEARIFFELLDYPNLGNASDFEVIQSDLEWLPQLYIYGDTTNKTLSISAYELTKRWSAFATWDSIWAADGTSEYYNTGQPKISSFTKELTSTDSAIFIPFDNQVTKKWLVQGADSATALLNYGVVIQAEVASSIRQLRYLVNGKSTLRLRVVTKHKDSTTADTNFLEPFAANFINTPAVSAGQLVVQGARKLRVAFDIDLDSIPPLSILMGGSFTVKVDVANSSWGSYGIDELMDLAYNTSDTSRLTVITRIDANNEFHFTNIGSLLQLIRVQGGKGTLYLQGDLGNEVWRMNRLRFFGFDAEPQNRPRLIVSYAVPRVFK